MSPFFAVSILSLLAGVQGLPQGSPASPVSPASPAAPATLPASRLPSYAPKEAPCGKEPLVRKATGVSKGEQKYIESRKQKTQSALQKWLSASGESFKIEKNPTIALAVSGGGDRSMIIGAGVVQAFDERDSKDHTKGLFQSLAYQAGLSGGSWLLGTQAGNGFNTISALSKDLWEKSLVKNSLYPFNTDTAPEKPFVQQDMLDKAQAGFPVTVSEVWGRFVAYQMLSGQSEAPKDQVAYQMSAIKNTAAFKQHNGPYPIFTALGKEDIDGSYCDSSDNATQYEMHPFEFGSWDAGIKLFSPMEYLGSKVNDGKPEKPDVCVRGFDDLGFLMGTSSSKFNEECGNSAIGLIQGFLDPIVKPAQNEETTSKRQNLWARYPNPFKGVADATKVSKANELYLVDGGQANQNNPIWPFIQDSRKVDVLFVNDNSADTDDNWPNGTEILHTYQQAKQQGLTRMPVIPDVATFMSKGYYKKATVFGCNKPDQVTIIYLPNAQFIAAPVKANPASSQFDYPVAELQALIKNGNLVATQNGDPEWPLCLACAVAQKAVKTLPAKCTACLQKYCYEG